MNDIETMKERLKQENMELVLCHNDCWRENILYDKQSGQSSSRCSTTDEPKHKISFQLMFKLVVSLTDTVVAPLRVNKPLVLCFYWCWHR